jgi:hypothetical protein
MINVLAWEHGSHRRNAPGLRVWASWAAFQPQKWGAECEYSAVVNDAPVAVRVPATVIPWMVLMLLMIATVAAPTVIAPPASTEIVADPSIRTLALFAIISAAPELISKAPPIVSELPVVMVALLKEVLMLLLVVRLPASVTTPVPIKVVPLRARVPLLPAVKGPLIVDVAAPRESEPLPTLTVVEEFVDRLRTESLGPV